MSYEPLVALIKNREPAGPSILIVYDVQLFYNTHLGFDAQRGMRHRS